MIFANNNIDKLNFRLIKISIYLFQFKFNVKYRPGKKHVIPNALSRLLFGNGSTTLPKDNSNDFLNLDIYFCGILNFSNNVDCYIFRKKIINMTDEFKEYIFNGYIQENIWNKLIKDWKI